MRVNKQQTAREDTQELLKTKKRTAIQNDLFALESSRTKQTDALSCLMSGEEKEKQNLCMNAHDEYDKTAAMTDS